MLTHEVAEGLRCRPVYQLPDQPQQLIDEVPYTSEDGGQISRDVTNVT